jgi:hypothetical protein
MDSAQRRGPSGRVRCFLLPATNVLSVLCTLAQPTDSQGDFMRWLYMLVSGAAAFLFYGHGPTMAFYLSLLVFSVCFATFCLLYDEPLRRATGRINARLGQITARGINADEYQRLQSQAAVTTVEDRQFRWTPMSIANIAAGLTGMALLLWAVVIRFV